MFFDGHSDIWADVNIKRLNGESNILNKYHIDRLRKGNIEGAIFVIWVDPPYTNEPEQRVLQIFNSIDEELKDCKNNFNIVTNSADIEKAKADGKFYIVKGMEGISGLSQSIDSIDWIYNNDVRHASITWNEENAFGTGVNGRYNRGLTNLGKKAVNKMFDKGILVDVSHANERTFWDIVTLADKPIVASHSNARELCDAPRNLKDEQLKEIQTLNGLVGMNAFNMFVHSHKSKQNLQNFVRHMVYIADLIGVEHIGCGFDFDGFLPQSTINSYSSQKTSQTTGLEDCSKTFKLVKEMEKSGFSSREIEMISRDNWMRVIKEAIG